MPQNSGNSSALLAPSLPQELAEVIVSSVAPGVLPSCALVCNSWVYHSRLLQFSHQTITLSDSTSVGPNRRISNRNSLTQLLELLRSPCETLSPHLQCLSFPVWEDWVRIAPSWRTTRFPALKYLEIWTQGQSLPTEAEVEPFLDVSSLAFNERWSEGFHPHRKLPAGLSSLLARFSHLHSLSLDLTSHINDDIPFPVFGNLCTLQFSAQSLSTSQHCHTLIDRSLVPNLTHLILTSFEIELTFPSVYNLKASTKFIRSLRSLVSLHLEADFTGGKNIERHESLKRLNISKVLNYHHNPNLKTFILDLKHPTCLGPGINYTCTGPTTSLPPLATIQIRLPPLIEPQQEGLWQTFSRFISELKLKELESVEFVVADEKDESVLQRTLKNELSPDLLSMIRVQLKVS